MAKFRDHFPGWEQKYSLDAIVAEMVGEITTQIAG